MRFAKRPWGFWLVVLQRKHFKVKLLYFKKGGKLSMQRHNDRHELWLFLSGSGMLYLRGPVRAGDHALMRSHTWHQYTAKKATWVLEIQHGKTCKEQDIERQK